MDKKIKQLITRIKSHLIKLNGEKIKKVILYGSYARGEATKDSDIDVLVVVDDSLDPSEVRRALSKNPVIYHRGGRRGRRVIRPFQSSMGFLMPPRSPRALR